MNESRQGLATRTVRSMAWAYGSYAGSRLLVLLSTAVLARLLSPRDFGVVALAIVFITFLEAIKDLGLSQALIVASPEEEADRAQTVFAWSMLSGVGLALTTAAIAPLVASFFHQPQITAILPVLGLGFILRALGTTHESLARKHLNYKVRTISELVEASLRGVVGIGLALAGLGAWSLVIGFTVGIAANTSMLWILVDFHPRARLSRAHLRDLLGFGGVLTIVDVAAVVFYNTDYLFIGRVLGAASLGLYSIGFRIPELAILNVAHVAADVLFPAYSALDRERLREGYLTALRYLTILTFPLAAGLIVLARPTILVAFGPKWEGSITVTRVIAVYTLLAALAIAPGTVLKVTRRAWLMVLFAIPTLLALIALLIAFTKHGIVAVAVATTVLEGTVAPLQVSVVSRQLRLSLWASVRELLGPLLAAGAMAGMLLALEQLISSPVALLVLGVPLGAVVYLVMLWVVAHETLLELRGMAFPE